jgi:hypothetical protein
MRETKGIEELRGFEVVEGDPDVVGWEVVDRDGRRIGVVAELLADPENPSDRYLEVRLDGSPSGEEVLGQAIVGDAPHEMPASTIGEVLVRDSLLEVENQMTTGELPVFDRGEDRTLIPAGEARLENAMRRVHLDPHPSWSA